MRILEAICENSKVFINNGLVEVPNVKMLSEGGDSEGVLLLSHGDLIYVAQTSPDLKSALTILKDGFTKLASDVTVASGTAVDTGGATPTFASDMTNVVIQLTELLNKLR